jgi:hypothetical protein
MFGNNQRCNKTIIRLKKPINSAITNNIRRNMMRELFLGKRYKTWIIVIITISLFLITVFPGLSISGQTPTPDTADQGVFGEVIGLAQDGTSITIQTSSQKQIMVRTDQNTDYLKISITADALSGLMDILEAMMGETALTSTASILSLFGMSGLMAQPGSLNDISIGDTISINESTTDGTASQILIIKFQNIKQIRGPITNLAADSITITPASGAAATINWDSNTRFLLRGVSNTQTGAIANALYNETTNTAVIIIVKQLTASPSATALILEYNQP